jgi:hypothetical protein
MKRFPRSRRHLTLIGSMTAITILGVGISFAAAGWLSSGDGNASANGAASAPVPVVVALSSGTALTPGASTPVTINVTNNDATAATVLSVTAGSSALVNGSCAAGTVTTAALGAQSATIPAGGTVAYTLTATMAGCASPACRSQAFSIPVTVTLSSGTS